MNPLPPSGWRPRPGRRARPLARDELSPLGIAEEDRTHRAGGDPAGHAPPDLLEHESDGVMRGDRILIRLRERQRDEEERHAEAVVQTALDVEPLPDSHGKAPIGHDHLSQRGVGGRERDREHERLGPRELTEDGARGKRAQNDREWKPDPEQPGRQGELPAQGADVDPRRVGEEHERQGRLGQHPHRRALDVEVEPAEPLVADKQPGPDEENRCREHRLLEPAREHGVAEDEGRDDHEAPALHREHRRSATTPAFALARMG